MVVGVLVAIDIVTLTAWQILDPFYRKTSLGVPVVCSFLLLHSPFELTANRPNDRYAAIGVTFFSFRSSRLRVLCVLFVWSTAPNCHPFHHLMIHDLSS